MRISKKISIGGVPIGGDAGIAIQSMTNTDTRNVKATTAQINALADAGCDIVRVAVPDEQAAHAISEIKKGIDVPLVADIHFDYRLALAAIASGADKLRINPGNIGDIYRVREVVKAALDKNVPIRVGVNMGSLDADLAEKYGRNNAEALALSAERQVAVFEENGFSDIVLSVKASDLKVTHDANVLLSERFTYPLHIGVTEAGTPYAGIIKSAALLGSLLMRGIGDTLRVSLTANPLEEVKCAMTLLRALGLRKGVNVIACPTCGRTQVDLIPLAEKVTEYCNALDKNITVAVMGCVVNGPGEAKEADIGVACAKHSGVLFKKGELCGTYMEHELYDALVCAIEGFN